MIGLGKLPNLPPILVLDHRLETPVLNEGVADRTKAKLESQLQAIATQILRDRSHSISQLLERIYQILGNG
ncbi:MAG TPA: hypothetical protein DDZ80_09570 [Cyanobacteria bacterium UBA8803]|nr:hypothetical protein [Cyanobacteria bacterium UBA8803]